MIKSNNTISRDMLDILRDCKGQEMEDILYAKIGDNSSFEIIILRFRDFDIELWNLEQPDKEGGVSDLAKIIIKNNPAKDSSCPVGKYGENGEILPGEFTRKPIGKVISGITVHNELVQWIYEDKSFLLENTYAIVISLGKRFLHLTKSAEWSEIWDVSFHRTSIPKAPEWDESEGDKYEISHSVIEV